MASPMSQQLREHRELTSRLSRQWRQVVVLERLARAAGAARWYFAEDEAALEHVYEHLRGGSNVSFYFSRHLHVGTDDEDARQKMFSEITRHGELILGYPVPGDPEFEMAIISGPSELTEHLMLHPEGHLVVWGQWPPRATDGETAVTVDLVDADGVLRSHPH